MVHFIDSGGHFRQPINARYKWFCSECFLHAHQNYALARCVSHKTKAILYFLQTYCGKKHITCEVLCSPVSRLYCCYPQSWLKALQSYSQIKLSQLICDATTSRQSFKYVWVWIEIKCHLWEISLLLALDIALGSASNNFAEL